MHDTADLTRNSQGLSELQALKLKGSQRPGAALSVVRTCFQQSRRECMKKKTILLCAAHNYKVVQL